MQTTTKEQIQFLQTNTRDGGFLQSKEWLRFQQSTGKRIFYFEADTCVAHVIEHTLPWVGKYWYIPRGPVIAGNIADNKQQAGECIRDIIAKAKQENVGWIRIEPTDESALHIWQEECGMVIKKALHDTQPREILVISIEEDEQTLLSKMKSKTRYNIRLAEKKGVKVFTSRAQAHIDEFCDLVEMTAKRDGIISHPREYYQKMFRVLRNDMLKLYIAEYDGKIIAGNLVVVFGKYTTYMHGASSNVCREVMAPYLLQWRQIQDAKQNGCEYYDFGGVKTGNAENTWAGITRFKQGFAPYQTTTYFAGTYDIVVRAKRYGAYLILQKMKSLYKNILKG